MKSHWRLCSSCKEPIHFRAVYWVCNVSTCNRARTGLTFCSVSCWEAHLPMMRHRESWAVEQTAPGPEGASLAPAVAPPPVVSAAPPRDNRRVVPSLPPPRRAMVGQSVDDVDDLPDDILIVASKLKKYVRARSGMNTSDSVLSVLSDVVRDACDRAIRSAGEDGRRTVLDRDFPSRP
jgi:hypothetical protein